MTFNISTCITLKEKYFYLTGELIFVRKTVVRQRETSGMIDLEVTQDANVSTVIRKENVVHVLLLLNNRKTQVQF